MEKQDLINLIAKAKKVGIALCEWIDAEKCFDGVYIDEYGDFEVKFSYSCRGGDMEYDTVYISFDELISDSDDNLISTRLSKRAKEIEDAKIKHAKEKEESDKKALAEKEEKERKEFERLSLKFGSTPNT